MQWGPDLPASLACYLTRTERHPSPPPAEPSPSALPRYKWGEPRVGTVVPPPLVSGPAPCEVISAALQTTSALAATRSSLPGVSSAATGRQPALSSLCCSRAGVRAVPGLPCSARSPGPGGRGMGQGRGGKVASRSAVTCTSVSMKTFIAAYSGVLRGEHRAQAARSESFNGGSVPSREGSGRRGEGLEDEGYAGPCGFSSWGYKAARFSGQAVMKD